MRTNSRGGILDGIRPSNLLSRISWRNYHQRKAYYVCASLNAIELRLFMPRRSTHRGERHLPLHLQLPLWPILHPSRQPIPPHPLNVLHPVQGDQGVEGPTSMNLPKEENGKDHTRRRTTTTLNQATTTTTTITPTTIHTGQTTTKDMANPPAPSVVRVVEDTQPMSAGRRTAPGARLRHIRWLIVQKHRTVGPAVGPHTRTSSSILCGSSTSAKEPSVRG